MPLRTFRTGFENPVTPVLGCGGTEYPCPDVAALDRHLDNLRSELGRRTFPDHAAQLRTDIDLLLDRRLWLTWTASTKDRTR